MPHPDGYDDRPAPRRDEVAERILAMVRRLGLGPGDPLPSEAQLCRQLHASRSSVREALRMLAALDQVEVRHGQGTYVGTMGLRPLTDLLTARARLRAGDGREPLRATLCDLEGGAAERLVDTSGTNRADLLAGQAEALRDLALRGEPLLTPALEFHSALVVPLRDTLTGELVRALWDTLLALPLDDLPLDHPVLPGWGTGVVADVHRTLADAVRDGSPEELRTGLRTYYGC